jgi:broad specificity phosphatase PhoE
MTSDLDLTKVPRLLLVRHGASSNVRQRGLLDRSGVQRWREAYDAAGILDVSRPGGSLCRQAASARHIIASDLPRAVASAERLAPAREIRTSPLLRELPLAIPHWPTRLPLGAWDVLMQLGWSARILRGTDATTPERDRAAAAAGWLAAMVDDGSTALVVTHGVIRRLIAARLLVLGWKSAGRRGGYRHWSSWTFVGPGQDISAASRR